MLLVAVVVIVLVTTPFFGDLIGKFYDPSQLPWGQPNESFSGLLSVTINYADGTTKEYKPTPLSMLPMDIFDGGKKVSSLDLTVYATIVSEKAVVSSWKAITYIDVYAYEGTSRIGSSYFRHYAFIPTGDIWTSGEEKEIAQKTIQASDIDGYMNANGKPEGTFSLRFEASMELTATFSDGTSEVVSGKTTGEWAFTITPAEPIPLRISSVSLRISHSAT